MIIKTPLTDPEAEGVRLVGSVGIDSLTSSSIIVIQGGDFRERLVCNFALKTKNSLETFDRPVQPRYYVTYSSTTKSTSIVVIVRGYDVVFDDPNWILTDALNTFSGIDFTKTYLTYDIFVSKRYSAFPHKDNSSTTVTENLKGIMT